MKIGVIPLGKSPRPDMVAPLEEALGDSAEIIQFGALEELTLEDFEVLDRYPGESILHTNLPPSGKMVFFSRRHVHAGIPKALRHFERQGAQVATVLCTEPWSHYEFDGMYLEIRRLVRNFLSAINAKGQGVIITHPDDLPEDVVNRWRGYSGNLTTKSFGPEPSDEELNVFLDELVEIAPDYVVFDCTTFGKELKRKFQARLNCPVILPLTVLANALREIASA